MPHRATQRACDTDQPPRILFSTHLDTVPPHVPARLADGAYTGAVPATRRGSWRRRSPRPSGSGPRGVDGIGLLFVVDEEMGSVGARASQCAPLAGNAAGSSTVSRPIIGSRSAVKITAPHLVHRRRPGPLGLSEHGGSAIDALLDVLADVRRATWPTDRSSGDHREHRRHRRRHAVETSSPQTLGPTCKSARHRLCTGNSPARAGRAGPGPDRLLTAVPRFCHGGALADEIAVMDGERSWIGGRDRVLSEPEYASRTLIAATPRLGAAAHAPQAWLIALLLAPIPAGNVFLVWRLAPYISVFLPLRREIISMRCD